MEDVPQELRVIIRRLAETKDENEIAGIVGGLALGAADAAIENCAAMLEQMAPEIRRAFPVPDGMVAVAPLAAVEKFLADMAAAFREGKSEPA